MATSGPIRITIDATAAMKTIEQVQAKLALIDTCQAEVGLYMDGLVPPDESIRDAMGCTETATVTLIARCIHDHTRRKRFCAEHGEINPRDAKWFCGPCAREGHDCPVRPQLVDDEQPEASDG